MKIRSRLSQQIERLPIGDSIDKARRVTTACRSLVGDLSASCALGNKRQQDALGARDADDKASILASVLSGQGNRSLAVY